MLWNVDVEGRKKSSQGAELGDFIDVWWGGVNHMSVEEGTGRMLLSARFGW
jgi:hypothetical protein